MLVIRLIAAVASLVVAIIAVLFVLAGCLEMITGRNAPGWLGGSVFYRRGWAKEPHRSKASWRYNGFFVLGFGFSFVVVSLSLFLVAIQRLP